MLTQLLRNGAQKIIAQAVEAELEGESLQKPEARQTFKSPHTVFELMANDADKTS